MLKNIRYIAQDIKDKLDDFTTDHPLLTVIIGFLLFVIVLFGLIDTAKATYRAEIINQDGVTIMTIDECKEGFDIGTYIIDSEGRTIYTKGYLVILTPVEEK